ncbi:hypothetical protein PFICI_06732 [Pestalotiopsis fici W106-1]|uniref:PRISE-like Rossmann-fold domain-containing protein n=1 Tax=Pestalotiopsis fici (strain W106-1 / CGMCC3.15140) TaxID=1229662 RepID=W3X6R4_PESFW|nr:uncharacterized protein PFICI_06732 [Pestalotiopsis fici W106-1]ETS81730.1 hypothetical protein PFICI_06732 [Pestalotiopsis fici W106-1]
MSAPHHALVFGASGILGWSVVNQILKNYPERGVFHKVTALSNRPLSEENAFWPLSGPGKPVLSIVDGIDLTLGTMDHMKETLRLRVPDIGSVTHIYYFAYLSHPDFPTESHINLGMLQRGFAAAESLAPNLHMPFYRLAPRLALDIGYGIHLPQRPFQAPFTEEMSDVHQPWHDELFYYVLHAELDKLQKGKSWKFAEVRCGPVVGFVPHKNPYNLAGACVNFLSVYKFLHEQGHPDAKSEKIPWPAAPEDCDTLFNDGGQDIFAEFSIYLCLHPEIAGNSEVYNIGDASEPASMSDRWRVICSLFGLQGVPPVEKSDPAFVLPSKFLHDHPEAVNQLKEEQGVTLQEIALEDTIEVFTDWINFDHHFSFTKTRKTGFDHELSLEDSWRMVFDRYHQAKHCYYGRTD